MWPAPGDGRPWLPILTPDTLANTACPSVGGKEFDDVRGGEYLDNSPSGPVGIPEPVNNRTG